MCGFDRSAVALTECAKLSVVKICICLKRFSQQSITQMAKNCPPCHSAPVSTPACHSAAVSTPAFLAIPGCFRTGHRSSTFIVKCVLTAALIYGLRLIEKQIQQYVYIQSKCGEIILFLLFRHAMRYIGRLSLASSAIT